LGVPKTRKIKKVTTSQDDGLVGGLKIIPVGCAKNEKKVTPSQDDGLVGICRKTSHASQRLWRAALPTFLLCGEKTVAKNKIPYV
jgi:hypothetical protein